MYKLKKLLNNNIAKIKKLDIVLSFIKTLLLKKVNFSMKKYILNIFLLIFIIITQNEVFSQIESSNMYNDVIFNTSDKTKSRNNLQLERFNKRINNIKKLLENINKLYNDTNYKAYSVDILLLGDECLNLYKVSHYKKKFNKKMKSIGDKTNNLCFSLSNKINKSAKPKTIYSKLDKINNKIEILLNLITDLENENE